MISFKKILAVALVSAIVAFAQNTDWYTVNPLKDTFYISTEEDINGLAWLVNTHGMSFQGKTIILLNDITLSQTHTPIGGSGTNATRFRGTFDGGGHSISNVSVSGSYTEAGLFGYVEGGQIKNLVVNVTSISGGSCAGGLAGIYDSGKPIENCGVNISGSISATIIRVNYCGTGGLVGMAISTFTINNSYTTGNISFFANNTQYYGDISSGGLVGYLEGSVTINNSYTTGNISSSTTYTYVGGSSESYNSGGLIGSVTGNATINNSYATGNISSSVISTGASSCYSGGLLGNAYGWGATGVTINNSYASGIATATTELGGYAGGIFGYASGRTNGTSAVYYNSAGANNAAGLGATNGIVGITGLTTEQLKNENSFIGWDFENIWAIDENGEINDGYPYLRSLAQSYEVNEIDDGNNENNNINGNNENNGNNETDGNIDGNNENNGNNNIDDGNRVDGNNEIGGIGGNNNIDDGNRVDENDEANGTNGNDNTSIGDVKKSNNHYGIKFKKNVVSDELKIVKVTLPDGKDGKTTKTVIYDNTGNVVFSGEGKNASAWNLQNNAGRFVANGSYLVIVEAKSANGMIYRYSAIIGVKR
ncbi:MAG: hypothetical protein FWF51_08590 [Chitinivibrionia bacterium]|nr:hypothetical protein [Chitinivibrionia bacterium]